MESPSLSRRRVVGAACGRYHTAVITSDGGVYTFGLNDRGQLGRAGSMGMASTDKCVCDSAGECGCGVNGAEIRTPVGAPCYGGGACRSGVAAAVQSGVLSSTSSQRASVSRGGAGAGAGAFAGAFAVAVAAGRYSTAVVLHSGDVVTWGLNLCGASEGVTAASLLEDPETAAEPRLVRLTRTRKRSDEGGEGDGFARMGDKAKVIAIGYVHMAILTASGVLFTCDTGFDGYASVGGCFFYFYFLNRLYIICVFGLAVQKTTELSTAGGYPRGGHDSIPSFPDSPERRTSET